MRAVLSCKPLLNSSLLRLRPLGGAVSCSVWHTQTGALQALLVTIMAPEQADEGGGRPGSGGESNSPVKIALFSIGNMCAHRECRCAASRPTRCCHMPARCARTHAHHAVCSSLGR